MKQVKPGSPAAWLLASRPKTLFAALSPILVATALAFSAGGFHLLSCLAALACALLLQVGVNIANDYFDHLKGVDGADRLGPTRAAAGGLLNLKHMRTSLFVLAALILAGGAYLVSRGGWPILLLGLTALLSMFLYSAGPLPLASHALGDLFVFIYFGFAAVCGTYFVQTGNLPGSVWLAALPMACLITAILVVNNLRDRETDSRSGKRTLAVLLGRRGTQFEYLLLVLSAFLVPGILAWLTKSWWYLLPMTALPPAISLIKGVYTLQGRELNRVLARTSLFTFAYALLFCAGVVVSG